MMSTWFLQEIMLRDEVIEQADLVTEMREIKHPFKSGIKAKKGIDF